MTPDDFIRKWRSVELKERSAAQSHFNDLCLLLEEKNPVEADPKGEWYCFERGATKTTGGEGWADVWKRHHFGWEYKGKRKDLTAAFAQLQQYALALENPPLLVVSDMDRFEVHTNWTNSVSKVHQFSLDDLRDGAVRDVLKAVFSDPKKLDPGQSRQELTQDAAAEFAGLALRLREKGNPPGAVAHFVNRLVFCMFAEDIGLLPNKMFARMLDSARERPEEFQAQAALLFRAMREGGKVGFERVEWFNGGLFDDDSALSLDKWEIESVIRAAALDWAEIDPSILGTLFERGLDPDKRSQLGAHYTDRDKIMQIIEPVVREPLLSQWDAARAQIAEWLSKSDAARLARNAGGQTRAHKRAVEIYKQFLERLRNFTVLDPACGSGNFLYLALKELKDLEHRCMIEAEAMGLQREFPHIGPSAVKGIEINAYAAELARVTVWIGEIQWMRRNGFNVTRDPILRPLETIECRDAILNADGTEADWPVASVIVGNPPFLGDKKMAGLLGREYVSRLRSTFKGRVSGGADLVTFWFEKAGKHLAAGKADRFGLVSTNGIRFGKNREVLESILARGLEVFSAVSDDEWTVDGAAVRVSLVCVGRGNELASIQRTLDGIAVPTIYADLTGGAGKVDVTAASPLPENKRQSFFGFCLAGAFGLSGDEARAMLSLPLNTNGRNNSDVVRPLWNGIDVLRRHKDRWVVDFGATMSEEEAAHYEKPFEFVRMHVLPKRKTNNRPTRRLNWWRHGEPRPGLRKASEKLSRWLVTPETSLHRVFRWLPKAVDPEHSLIVIARDDDTTFGILQSRIHVIWVIAQGNRLGVGNHLRYNATRTFETFPFPNGLAPNIPAANYVNDPRSLRIAEAARKLHELREAWLNPKDLVERVPEVVPVFPERIVAVSEDADRLLRKRTLTKLYNERPTWLDNAHRELDSAVAAAYGWPHDLSDHDVLARLYAINQARSGQIGTLRMMAEG